MRSPFSVGARVLLVELVGAHDAMDLVAVALGVVVRDRAPEAGDLEHHLGAVVAQEVEVVGRLVVVPDVVEDRRVDVALAVAEVRVPVPRQRVEVDDLRLLAAVAAALPREHRARVARRACRRPRFAQAPVAVHEQLARDVGQARDEVAKDVQLVPEHVPAVRLAVQAARRDAGVVVGRVHRADLEDVRDVQAQQLLHARLAGHVDVARAPQLVPRADVAPERLLEVRVARARLAGIAQRLVDRAVARRVERDELLDAHRLALPDLEADDVLDVVLHLVQRALDVHGLAAAEHARAGGLGDVDVRLARLDVQGDDLRPERARRDGVEVAPLELAVARDAAVRHAPVERRHDLDRTRPVLRGERPLDRGLVGVGHAREAPAAQRRLAPAAVAEAQLADDHRGPDVVFVAVFQELDVAEADRVLVVDLELQHEPVGEVHEVLVEDRPPAHDRRLTVVEAVRVRAGVVDVVGVLPLSRAARAEVAVARRGQRLAQPLLGRVEPVEHQRLLVHAV